MTDSPTPPAQAMTAEEHASGDQIARYIVKRVEETGTFNMSMDAAELNLLAQCYLAARQTWEAERARLVDDRRAAMERTAEVLGERAVLVTEAVSAAAKVREMEERIAELEHTIEYLEADAKDTARHYHL